MLLSEIESTTGISQKNSLFYDILRNWYINERRNGKKYTVEGHIGIFEIRSITYEQHGLSCIDLVLFDEKEKTFVAGVELTGFGKNARSWQADRIGIANRYQGMNLSVKIYEFLVKQKNLILLTGMSQTAGGKSIWERLSTIPGIFIFGYDVKNKESFQVDQKDLFNEDVYTDALQKEHDELQEEYDELEWNADDQEIKKQLIILKKKIDDLQREIWNVGDYIRLVAIKKH